MAYLNHEYERSVREWQARQRPPVPPAVTAGIFPPTEMERRGCKPEKVVVVDRKAFPEGDVRVVLSCPRGATRTRVFEASETKCYVETLSAKKKIEKKEPSAEQKVKVALTCTGALTPTLTEQFTGGDVSRQEAAKILDEHLKARDVSTEHTWQTYRKFPLRPKPKAVPREAGLPPIAVRKLERDYYNRMRGLYFAGEAIHTVTPEKKREWEQEIEETKEKATL